jgi:hypothetical protein
LLCPGERCEVTAGGQPMYWDAGHLTQTTARGYGPAFTDALRPLLELP